MFALPDSCFQMWLNLILQQLIYYDVDASGAKIAPTASSIISTLEGILSGSIAYKNSENILERLVRVSDNFDVPFSRLHHRCPVPQR